MHLLYLFLLFLFPGEAWGICFGVPGHHFGHLWPQVGPCLDSEAEGGANASPFWDPFLRLWKLSAPPGTTAARKEKFSKHLGVGPEFESILCQILDTLGQQKHRFRAVGVVKITVLDSRIR